MVETNDTTEEWRAVVGAEGRYEVSSEGNVRSFFRKHPGSPVPNPLHPHLHKQGYLTVTISFTRSPARQRPIHRLVADAFLGPLPAGLTTNHINGRKTDNRAANLEYVSAQANCEHARITGLLRPSYGDRNGARTCPEAHVRGSLSPHAKLVESQVREIRERHADGESIRSLSTGFGVTRLVIQRIVRRKGWAHVP